MVIDNKKLKEIYVPIVRPPRGTICEHFYQVPNTTDYVLSDYGRLYRWGYQWTKRGGYNSVKSKVNLELGEETYLIQFDGNQHYTEVPIRKLMAQVFYPDKKIFTYLITKPIPFIL